MVQIPNESILISMTTKKTVDRKKLFELYMKKVDHLCEACYWVTTVTPEMKIGFVSDVIEEHPEIIK